jgi:hypothetical protein
MVDYPEPEVEIQIVADIMGNDDIAIQMVKFVNEVRAAHMGEETHIPDTVSTGKLLSGPRPPCFSRKSPASKARCPRH